ncbi:MAG: hypothetical protein NW224_27910 [Leptolyngbyaceae cyanobacterium bins.302]|nr:hypothetical protein [Leptolyngbyaceae cyanobacterium bins.302]
MKMKTFVVAGLLSAIALATPGVAQETLIAFPGININITPAGNNNNDSKPADNNSTSTPQSFKGFSGQSTEYADTYNGFKIKIPTEFNLTDKGMTTTWNGPLMDGGSALIYINAAPMKGVASKTVYEINLKSKKDDRNYTEVVPVTVKMGNKTAYAFRCKEAPNKPGTPDAKAPTDIHRWHLMVFGNETVYTLGFTGPFASFQSNKLQATYDNVIKSVELVPMSGR